ncbi:MAG: hypothetical protein COV46_08520 [Deltaproteobacteria bacterium CG11_big_fil_rev_8_21_14_0_20_49_13]|nr:MAG: hypothetical protein COV46_08520 [Deltaproteobacteria bacterium CG11_big_fil_rev_8_21_14_0_20_49_13]
MILKMIQSILTAEDGVSKDSSATDSRATATNIDPPFDLVHEALKRDAKSLNGLVSVGQPVVERKKLKERVKERVKRSLLPDFDTEEITEEVTERIMDAAEYDSHYRSVFDDK